MILKPRPVSSLMFSSAMTEEIREMKITGPMTPEIRPRMIFCSGEAISLMIKPLISCGRSLQRKPQASPRITPQMTGSLIIFLGFSPRGMPAVMMLLFIAYRYVIPELPAFSFRLNILSIER